MAYTCWTSGFHVDSMATAAAREPTVDGGSNHSRASGGVHREEGMTGPRQVVCGRKGTIVLTDGEG